jgi:Flp pilus assembly protein protease CpaA
VPHLSAGAEKGDNGVNTKCVYSEEDVLRDFDRLFGPVLMLTATMAIAVVVIAGTDVLLMVAGAVLVVGMLLLRQHARRLVQAPPPYRGRSPRRRKRSSPACGTTMVSGSAAQACGSTSAGSR